MKELLNMLAKNGEFKKEQPLLVYDVIEAQKGLVQAGFPLLPKEFIDLLKVYNGIKAEDGAVLGISPSDESLDIVAFNKLYNHSESLVVLGYDDFSFLAYDADEGDYLLLDREDGMEIDDFEGEEFESAISSVLHF